MKRGSHYTEEERAAMSAARKGQPGRPKSDAERAKISASLMGNTRTLGYVHTAETRAKLSASRVGKKFPGRVLTAEHRANLSAAHIGRYPSLESRAKMSAAQRGRKCSSEFCAMRRAIQTGKIPSLETRAKMSAAHKGRTLTPEVIARQVAGRRAAGGWNHTPESRAKLSAVQIGKVIPLETRTKMSATWKARWADGRSNFQGVHGAKRYTKLAQALHAHLTSQGIYLEVEVRFGRFTVDLFDREHRVGYEADGAYWHERKETETPGWHATRDNYLLNVHGVKVVRYTDKEIKVLTGYRYAKKRAVAA